MKSRKRNDLADAILPNRITGHRREHILRGRMEEKPVDFPFGPIPHWVKCSERLPDEGQWVLLYSNDIYFGHLTRDGHHWIADEEDWLLNEFTHWMPLPPPPRNK